MLASTRERSYEHSLVLGAFAVLMGMSGNATLGRKMAKEALDILDAMGIVRNIPTVRFICSEVERLAGDLQAAADHLRVGVDSARVMNEQWWLCTDAAELARIEASLGHVEAATELIEIARDATSADDADAIARTGLAEAQLRSQAGDHAAGIARADEAVEALAPTEWFDLQGRAQLERARVLEAAGDQDGARGAAEVAQQLFERKGNVISARVATAFVESVANGTEGAVPG